MTTTTSNTTIYQPLAYPRTVPLVIDAQDALDALTWAIDTYGSDHIYTHIADTDACVYAWPDASGQLTPQCLVGVALAHLGVPLQLMYGLGNRAPIDSLADELRCRVGIEITADAVNILAVAQAIQDNGISLYRRTRDRCTWGDALAAARAQATTSTELNEIRDFVNNLDAALADLAAEITTLVTTH